MRNHYLVGILWLLLSGCDCDYKSTETRQLFGLSGKLFANNTGPYLFSDEDTVACSADNLGIYVLLKDSVTKLDNQERARCRIPLETVYENPSEQITVVSQTQFLTKNPGESLNEYFLCADRNVDFPSELKSESITTLSHESFVLLLKPNLGVPQNSHQQFITRIKLSDRTISDTSQTILFQ